MRISIVPYGLCFLLGLAICLVRPADVSAQQRRAGPKATQQGENVADETPDPAVLPDPFTGVGSNIRDLETTGFLEVEAVNFRPGGGIYGDRDAVVWTLRTRRPITARHLEILLEQFVDVRFYDTKRNRKALLHQTLLVHPVRIRDGAVNGVILGPREYVNVWIHLRETDIRRLRSLKADFVELGKLPS